MGNIINASVNQEGLAILAALEESALAETSAKTSKSQGGVMGFNYSESTYAPHVKSLPAAGTPSSPHKSTTGRSLPHTKKEIKRMIKNHSPGITPRTSISTFYSRRVGSETPVEASIRVGWGETMDVDDQDLQNLSMLPMGTPSFNLSPKKMSTPVKPPPHSTTYVAVPTPGAGAPLGTTFVATPAASANATFDACVKSCPGAAHNATFTKSSGSAGRRQASPRHDATFTKPSASAAAADAAVNVCVNSCPRVASSGRRPTAPITAVTKARPKSGKGGAFIRKKITKLLDQQSKQEVLLLSAKTAILCHCVSKIPVMKKKKKETDVQQLVIPRGMLGPGEVAVIEIPKRYHKAPVVVVKKKQGEIASSRAQNFFITTPYDESDVSRRGSRGIQDTTNSLQVPLPQMTQTCPGQFPGVSNPHQSISGQPRTPNNPVALNMTLPQVNQALSMLGFPNVANLATMMQPQQPMHPQQPQVGSCCGSNLHPPMPPRASCSPPLPWNSQCSGHVDLAYKERMEQEMFSTSLDEFQRARRKFLTSAKALSQKLSKISNSSTESY